MILDRGKSYSRINSHLVENGVEILRFIQKFSVDIDKFNEEHYKYHEKYISDNPDLIEWLIDDEELIEYYRDEIQNEKILSKSTIINNKEESEEIGQEKVDSFNPTWPRKKQVEFYLERGVEKPSEIANKIGANPSYVQRLIKELKS